MALAVLALTFTWLGMVLGISFLEAPLKFRAPGITKELGLGIGRLVFTALNRVELIIASALILIITVSQAWNNEILLSIPLGILTIQTVWLLPALKARINLILTGQDLPKSKHHIIFILLEVCKVLSLIIYGMRIDL